MPDRSALRLRTARRNVAVIALGAVGALCAACPGSLDDPDRFYARDGEVSPDGAGGCLDVPTAVFAATCTDSTCHNAKDKAQGLDLQSPDVASRLVGVGATGGAGTLVDPLSPEASILYQKLSFSPPYGSRMPYGKTPLDPMTTACVLAWITSFAPTADTDATPSADAGLGTDATIVETRDSGPADTGTGTMDAARPDARATEAGMPVVDAGAPVDAGPRDAIADVVQSGG